MTSLKKPTVHEGAPQVPQNSMVTYGSGLVYGGNVYPVLVDGVPMRPPLGAHQAAMQQRMQMQQALPQAPQAPHATYCPKPIVQYPTCQRTGTRYPAPSYMSRPSQQSSVSCPGPVMARQHPMSNNLAMVQPLQAQILQRQQMQTSMGSPCGTQGYYNLPTNAGDDSCGWNGYAMMQPMDCNKPYSFGWSLTD